MEEKEPKLKQTTKKVKSNHETIRQESSDFISSGAKMGTKGKQTSNKTKKKRTKKSKNGIIDWTEPGQNLAANTHFRQEKKRDSYVIVCGYPCRIAYKDKNSFMVVQKKQGHVIVNNSTTVDYLNDESSKSIKIVQNNFFYFSTNLVLQRLFFFFKNDAKKTR